MLLLCMSNMKRLQVLRIKSETLGIGTDNNVLIKAKIIWKAVTNYTNA